MSRRRVNSDVPIVLALCIGFVGFVWVLTKATEPMLTALSFASNDSPRLYATFLALLVVLPGALLTLPRAFASAPPTVQPSVRERRELAGRRQSFVKTDLLALATLLVAQVPLPAPWAPAGKAATIANVTRSGEIVEVSVSFASWSIAIFALGLVAAVIAKVYSHAIGLRVIAVLLALVPTVVAWYFVTRTL